jgi:RNA polymerase sigma-70 factor (ECF subfamily)
VRATWRLALDHQRSARRRLRREHGVAGETSTAHDAAETSERDARLWRAIDGLPEKLRLTLVLSGIEGHDTRDVAALLGIPEGTVKSRLFLARQALRERLS